MPRRHVVCREDELPPGERRIITIGTRSIGIFNVAGEFYALRNACPHQLAPLCRGRIVGEMVHSQVGEYVLMRKGEIIRCPWHGWEFDIKTGRSIFNPHRVRVKSYEVRVEREGEAGPVLETRTVSADDEDPSVETYPVKVEERMVVVYV